jgi:hypothetical protein
MLADITGTAHLPMEGISGGNAEKISCLKTPAENLKSPPGFY